MKQRIYTLLISPEPEYRAAQWINGALVFLIVASSLGAILETVESVSIGFGTLLGVAETVSMLVFTVEYVARLWACTEAEGIKHPFIGRLKFAVQPLSLVDLLAIAPFWLPWVTADLVVLRLLRLIRILRLFKLARYSRAIRILVEVFRLKQAEIAITLFVGFILVVIASSLIYALEHEAQPEAFGSIPHAMWWAVATLTTVGYGDIYPVTALGKLLAALVAVLGVGMFALPAGLLASGFSEAIASEKGGRTCPHCGGEL